MDNFWMYCMARGISIGKCLMMKDIIEKNGSFEEYEDCSETLNSYARVVTGTLGTRGDVYAPYTFKNEYNVSLHLSNRRKYVESIRKFTDQYGEKNVKKINFYFDSDKYKHKTE